MPQTEVTIRRAEPRDAERLRLLAALDRRPPLGGRVLLAEVDGVPIVALALGSGVVAADPLRMTAGAVRVLRRRRYQLLRQGGRVGPAWALPRRPGPAPAAV